MIKRATRLDLANALAKKTGISSNKANEFLLDITSKAKRELVVNGNSVRLFGVCILYRKDVSNPKMVTTGSMASSVCKDLNISREEGIMLERELTSIILNLLRNGFKVVITGLVSVVVQNNKIKCASAASLRGGDNVTPCRVSLDKLFKRSYEEGIVL